MADGVVEIAAPDVGERVTLTSVDTSPVSFKWPSTPDTKADSDAGNRVSSFVTALTTTWGGRDAEVCGALEGRDTYVVFDFDCLLDFRSMKDICCLKPVDELGCIL